MMIGPRKAEIATALAVLALMTGACARRSQLFARIAQLAGPSARDCGHVNVNEDPASAMRCAENAISKRTPFRVSVDGRTVDSAVTDALVGSSDGRLTWVRFDADTSGGSLLPLPKIFERPCSEVTFLQSEFSGRAAFECVRPAT
jgi:hypothetical protein